MNEDDIAVLANSSKVVVLGFCVALLHHTYAIYVTIAILLQIVYKTLCASVSAPVNTILPSSRQ